MGIAARNPDQRNEACLPILAAGGLGEVDRMVELPKCPAKLNVSFIGTGECGICSGQSCEQKPLNYGATDTAVSSRLVPKPLHANLSARKRHHRSSGAKCLL